MLMRWVFDEFNFCPMAKSSQKYPQVVKVAVVHPEARLGMEIGLLKAYSQYRGGFGTQTRDRFRFNFKTHANC